jgi:hypothetical protein
MPDYVTFRDNETGELTKIPVLQIWIDPRYPDAHRDPELRRYLDERGAAEGYGALIRLNSRDAFTLWPPSVSSDGLWHEMTGEIEPEHKPLAAMVTHVA